MFENIKYPQIYPTSSILTFYFTSNYIKFLRKCLKISVTFNQIYPNQVHLTSYTSAREIGISKNIGEIDL